MDKQAETRPRCAALARSGQPCKNYALSGSDYCRIHRPSQPPKRRASKANQAQVDPVERVERRQLAAELDRLTLRARLKMSDHARDLPPPAGDDSPAKAAEDWQAAPGARSDEKDSRFLYDTDLQWAASPGPSPLGLALLGAGALILFRWLLGRKSSK